VSKQIIINSFSGRIDLLALHESKSDTYPYYLESSAVETVQGSESFDILFAYPQQLLEKKTDEQVYLNNKLVEKTDFLQKFDSLWVNEKNQYSESGLPFLGGWFVYLGYELVNEIEPGLSLTNFDNALPIAFASRVPVALMYSHKDDVTFLVCEKEFEKYSANVEQDIHDLTEQPDKYQDTHIVNEELADRYTDSIQKILQYIKDGDVFQVNLSRAWNSKANNQLNASEIYRKLRTTNPAPFSALVKHGRASIVSSSPERLVRVKNNKVETRPIAGTRPRGKSSSDDQKLREELLNNYKERAEHIMLIDLERNDLGRISQPGTINVDELMTIETYAHVHHIVSNISGKLKENTKPGEVLRAVFPGGTITGCPKVRCMEIINELEQAPRSAYTGSLGYVNQNGDMDFNILIRTLIVNGDEIQFRAGAGIVADSIPENELKETRAKAKGMLLAVSSG